jgi:hypothetical protein
MQGPQFDRCPHSYASGFCVEPTIQCIYEQASFRLFSRFLSSSM